MLSAARYENMIFHYFGKRGYRMKSKKCLKIGAAALAAMMALSVGMTGCQKTENASSTTSASGSTASGGSASITYKGTINFYPQAYNPVAPTKDNPNPPTKFKEVAADYQKLHPDIKISFVANPPAGTDYETWLKTKAAGGQVPDLVWEQAPNANTSASGIWTDLVPFMNKANPYVEGNKQWIDLFPKAVINQIKDVSGKIYVIDADYVDTLIFYNKAMFQKAGITETPKTWEEMIEDCKKLKQANPGVAPMGIDMSTSNTVYSWFARVFNSNLYYKDIDKIDIDGSKGNSTLSKIVAVKKGIYGASDPRWCTEWFQVMKDFSQYWQPGYSTAPQGGIIMSFVNKKVAMYYDGTWANKSLKDDKAPDFGSFPVPQITANTCKGGNDSINTAGAAGGPYAAWQYAIPTKKADNSMTDEKLQAVVDFAMFTTTPENNEKVCNELGEFIPTIVGAKPPESLSGMAEAAQHELLALDGACNLSMPLQQSLTRELQQYLLGKKTLEQAVQACDQATKKEVDQQIKQHPDWDIDKYLK